MKADPSIAHLPVILITGHEASAQLKTEGLDAGADDFLTRPMDYSELMAKIRVMLRIKHSEDQLRDTNVYLKALIADITESKKMEIRLRQSQKLESMGTLAGGVAHEINNPVNGIMNYAQLIIDKFGEGNATLSEFAGEIIKESERVVAIVHDLLSFSREEGQAYSLARLCDIVESALSLTRSLIRRDQITLHVDVSEDLPLIRCRKQQIRQVLMNLVTNACDALEVRYPNYSADAVINVTARPIRDEEGEWMRLTVEDHGCGIEPEVKERMFDPFFTTKPKDEGTGLGLSVSHGIVTEHEGRLRVESEPGDGTRFHLDLPVDRSEGGV